MPLRSLIHRFLGLSHSQSYLFPLIFRNQPLLKSGRRLVESCSGFLFYDIVLGRQSFSPAAYFYRLFFHRRHLAPLHPAMNLIELCNRIRSTIFEGATTNLTYRQTQESPKLSLLDARMLESLS